MCRNTPTSTSVRFAADPHAAKQKTNRVNGTAKPGYTRRAFLLRDAPTAACGWTTDSPAIPTPPTVASSAGSEHNEARRVADVHATPRRACARGRHHVASEA